MKTAIGLLVQSRKFLLFLLALCVATIAVVPVTVLVAKGIVAPSQFVTTVQALGASLIGMLAVLVHAIATEDAAPSALSGAVGTPVLGHLIETTSCVPPCPNAPPPLPDIPVSEGTPVSASPSSTSEVSPS